MAPSGEERGLGIYRYLLLLALTGVMAWSTYGVFVVGTDWRKVGDLQQVWRAITRFFPPNWPYVLELGRATFDTFLIAVIGTFLALILALPVAWLAARNITPFAPVTYPIGRFIMTVSRSVHEVVWALIFVAALGLGPFAGILALGVRSIGFMSKLTAEQIENIDYRPIEAIRSTGASGAQVVLYGIIPQILPLFIGSAIFQWDINIRRATIIGIVGGGGLGLIFSIKMMAYQYTNATAVLVAILGLVLLGEFVSTKLRTMLT
ncbi:MAG: phosphonate ABC transporter, permease protein PhnE [Deltaproteobacteria bacterium]|nr:phosphonate ABC transporter, permease protein PhnE [Deltaproteobacteria bacterium]MBW2122651.1 phosphonate ABC transporter, permease protein PhnE [Deltaproteobacteria bacterium]